MEVCRSLFFFDLMYHYAVASAKCSGYIRLGFRQVTPSMFELSVTLAAHEVAMQQEPGK